MYANYNDNELIYLIKDGNSLAKEYLFNKYSILIKKIYRDGFYRYKCQLYDFLQEGLLVLERVINTYNEIYRFSFFSYFKVCFTRRLIRLNETKDITFLDERVKYHFTDAKDEQINPLQKIIEYSIKDEDELTKLIIKECILENFSLTSFCIKYNLNYNETYIMYRKIRLKLEKILTN